MRTDTKALFWIIGSSFFIAIVAMGILAAAAFGVIPRELAAVGALICIVVGGISIGRVFSRGLATRGEEKREVE